MKSSIRAQIHYDEDWEEMVVDPPCDNCEYMIVEDIFGEYMCDKKGRPCPHEEEIKELIKKNEQTI